MVLQMTKIPLKAQTWDTSSHQDPTTSDLKSVYTYKQNSTNLLQLNNIKRLILEINLTFL